MTGLILLAAGGSVRLGRPKQLLLYRGRTLLRHAAETALASHCRPIVVVLGAHAKRLRLELAGLDVRVADNPDWEQGMGSSIRIGMTALETASPDLAGVVVMLCDQPLLTSDYLNRLVQTHRDTSHSLIASEYADTRGVPAFFSRALFPKLRALSGPQGAKQMMTRHASDIFSLPFPVGTIDVDTESDYTQLTHSMGNEDSE